MSRVDLFATDGGYPSWTVVRQDGVYRDPFGYGVFLRKGQFFPERVGHGGGYTRWHRS